MPDTKSGIEKLIQTVLKNSQFILKEELSNRDIPGLDSLNFMQVLAKIEKEFSIRFKAKDVAKLKNFGDLVRLVDSLATAH